MASAKKPKPSAPAAAATKKSSFEKYEMVEINRQQIKNAPYNPRMISDLAKKKLKANLKAVGLLQPIVWNKRTGNIVSGHQRIDVLDSLEKTFDYTIKVACVDLDEKTEKEQNIFMNNPDAQGEFEAEGLEKMMKDSTLSLDAMGFDAADVYKFFGAESLTNDEMADMSNKLHGMRDQYAKMSEKNTDRNDTDFYMIVIFKNYESRKAFTSRLGLEDNRYVDGRTLEGVLKLGDSDPK